MGCCHNKNRNSFDFIAFGEKLRVAIDSNSPKKLSFLLDILTKLQLARYIDEDIIRYKEYKFNALSFSIYRGLNRIYKYLVSKGSSLSVAENLLQSQGMRTINLLCFKGHFKLLKSYLPNYLDSLRNSLKSHQSYSIDFNTQFQPNYDLAIHTACRYDQFIVFHFLYNTFKDQPLIPKDFDIYSKDEYYHEDSGLVACRSGSFKILKFLNEACSYPFTTALNKFKENALRVCVSGSAKRPSFSYLECISYLIEIVKIDLTYNYEELLIVAEEKTIIRYLEKKLKDIGINVTKEDLEIDEQKVARLKSNLTDGVSMIPDFSIDRTFISSISSNLGESSILDEGFHQLLANSSNNK